MCDCYEHKCETCDNVISLHIADFCTKRKNVHVFCPGCVKSEKIMKKTVRPNNYYMEKYPDNPEMHVMEVTQGIKTKQVFVDVVMFKYQVMDKISNKLSSKQVGKKGDVVVILCDDERAYGIHLN